MQPPTDLAEDERTALDQMQDVAPEINTAYMLAQDFSGLVREHASERLSRWIERALSSSTAELQNFAKGLQHDLAAVTAGISLPWSNGQTEGQVNRLRLIKRTMYGRAVRSAPSTRPGPNLATQGFSREVRDIPFSVDKSNGHPDPDTDGGAGVITRWKTCRNGRTHHPETDTVRLATDGCRGI